jgi:hypothetical protein
MGGSETGGDYGLAEMYKGLLGNRAQSQAFLSPQIEALQAQKEGRRERLWLLSLLEGREIEH